MAKLIYKYIFLCYNEKKEEKKRKIVRCLYKLIKWSTSNLQLAKFCLKLFNHNSVVVFSYHAYKYVYLYSEYKKEK